MNLMNRSGRGLKLFSLCVLALGLVAFGSAVAQAEGTWMVKGSNLVKTSENRELSGKIVAPAGVLLFTLVSEKSSIECKALELENMKLEPEGAISEASKNAKIIFSGCVAFLKGELQGKCVPVVGEKKGVIESEEGYGLLTLYKLEKETKDGVIVFVPKVGTTLAVIKMSATCVFGEETIVLGQLAVKDSEGNPSLEKEKATHTFEEFAPLTNLTVDSPLLGSSSKGFLDGKAEAQLLSGEFWNGLP